MKNLIIKKVSKIFTFTESSNGVLEDGTLYSGNNLSISAFNTEIYIGNGGNKKSYFLADVKYKDIVHTTFASLFNELMLDGFTGNFKQAEATAPIQLKDFYADVSNSLLAETDLYSYTTIANRLNSTGEKTIASYGGTFNDATASSQLKVYFGGVVIGDTGALTMSVVGAWIVSVSIMRTGVTTARSIVNISTPGASTASYTKYTALTGLTFTTTNILKITGTAGGVGGGTGDITATYGNIIWQPASI